MRGFHSSFYVVQISKLKENKISNCNDHETDSVATYETECLYVAKIE
jgi:hypothetical protein